MLKFSVSRNIKIKGALFVEYALIIAFVVAVGVVFLGEGSFKDSIASIFGKTGETLEVAVNGGIVKDPIKDAVFKKGYWNTSGNFVEDKRAIGIGEPIELKSGYRYYFHLDLTKVDSSLVEGFGGIGFIRYDKNGNLLGDSGLVGLDSLKTENSTYFTIDGDSCMYLNVQKTGAWNSGPSKEITDTEMVRYQELIRQGLTYKAVPLS